MRTPHLTVVGLLVLLCLPMAGCKKKKNEHVVAPPAHIWSIAGQWSVSGVDKGNAGNSASTNNVNTTIDVYVANESTILVKLFNEYAVLKLNSDSDSRLHFVDPGFYGNELTLDFDYRNNNLTYSLVYYWDARYNRDRVLRSSPGHVASSRETFTESILKMVGVRRWHGTHQITDGPTIDTIYNIDASEAELLAATNSIIILKDPGSTDIYYRIFNLTKEDAATLVFEEQNSPLYGLSVLTYDISGNSMNWKDSTGTSIWNKSVWNMHTP